VFGTGSLAGGATVSYRIDVTRGGLTYRIQISDGYDSGIQALRTGTVAIVP
jgi:hypothetical protein